MAIAASGMQNDLARLELISQNVANAATAGYKRQIPVNQAFAGQVDQLLAQPQVTSLQPRSSVIDPMAAPVRASGGSYDLAIEGDGFLEIAAPEGVRYTRHGALHLDSSGRLLGAQDMPVMGLSGEMRLANAAFEISPTGEIKQEGRLVGMLKLVHFDKPEQLQPAGNGLYSAGADASAEVVSSAKFRVGYLEQSNVNLPREMVSMTETVRHFEAMQRIFQGRDESLEKAIRKLGEF